MRSIIIFLIMLIMFIPLATATDLLTIGTNPNPPVENKHCLLYYDLDKSLPDNGGIRYEVDGNFVFAIGGVGFKGYHTYPGPGFSLPSGSGYTFTPGTHTIHAEFATLENGQRKVLATATQTITTTDQGEGVSYIYSVPEYPSVVVPVVVVLGLLLIMGRKK